MISNRTDYAVNIFPKQKAKWLSFFIMRHQMYV